jgi:hypothetical protein
LVFWDAQPRSRQADGPVLPGRGDLLNGPGTSYTRRGKRSHQVLRRPPPNSSLSSTASSTSPAPTSPRSRTRLSPPRQPRTAAAESNGPFCVALPGVFGSHDRRSGRPAGCVFAVHPGSRTGRCPRTTKAGRTRAGRAAPVTGLAPRWRSRRRSAAP